MAEQGARPQSGQVIMGVDPLTGLAQFLGVDTATGLLKAGGPPDYPVGATPIVATSGNVAAATATATLAAAAGKTTYITGFEISGAGATVGALVLATVTPLIGGVTFSYVIAAVAGVLLPNTPMVVTFQKAIPANAVNTAIAVSCPSLGVGNTNNVVNARGYQL